MWTLANVLLCGLVVVVAQVETESEVKWEADQPYQKVWFHDPAELRCCYSSHNSIPATWIKFMRRNTTVLHQVVIPSSPITTGNNGTQCSTLLFESAQLSDTGLYQCFMNRSNSKIFSHGTFLHVSEPLLKKLKFSEKIKNRILVVEGILLLLCVLLPATTILCKRKRQYELEKKKVTKETENIYQGLNLDECSSKYDEIHRSHNRGPYQDVCNASHEDAFQLEKP